MHIQVVVTHYRTGPDGLHDLVARHDPVAVEDQQLQQISSRDEMPRSCAARVSLRVRRSRTKSARRNSSTFEKPVLFDSVT